MSIKAARTESSRNLFVNKRNIFNPQTASILQLLVVGAGGGGSINNFPGSGGPGGAVELNTNFLPTADLTYTITVGAGGNPATTGGSLGNSGGFSRFTGTGYTLTANGGECFGTFQTRTILQSGTTYTGGNGTGGSGSGSSKPDSNDIISAGGQGRADSTGSAASIVSAGGTPYGILRSGTYYYGGGGGAGSGGLGTDGGGNGTGSGTGVQAGSVNSGGGGGGGSASGGTARAGASGVVIVQASRAAKSTTGSPAVISVATGIVYVYTGSGTITF